MRRKLSISIFILALCLMAFTSCSSGGGTAHPFADGDLPTDGDRSELDVTDGDQPADGDDSELDTDTDLADGDRDADGGDGDLGEAESEGDSTDGDLDPESAEAEEEICEGCLIESECIPNGQADPSRVCAICDASLNAEGWSPNTAGTLCRATAGACDIEESCDGVSLECPDDAFSTGVCDDEDPCTSADTCDGLGADATEHCKGTTYSCNGHGDCDPSSDICICNSKFDGDYCDECADGYYNYPNCVANNTPSEGFTTLSANGFWMGSPAGCPEETHYPGDCTEEITRSINEAIHFVELTHHFEIMDVEVSKADWRAAAEEMGWGVEPSYFGSLADGPDCKETCPVERVNLYEAMRYANYLSASVGLAPCYSMGRCLGTVGGGCAADETNCTTGTYTCASAGLASGYETPYECEGYRLPTEAEWEFAVRAGSHTAIYPSEGNDGTLSGSTSDSNVGQIAWYYSNSNTISGHMPRAVGTKEANDWGLYDMIGNVWEWTWDKYCAKNIALTYDPDGSSCTSDERVVRGGAFNMLPSSCRSAKRHYILPGVRDYTLGFRLVRTLHVSSCRATTCNSRGTCDDSGERVTCDCYDNVAGYWCNRCDFTHYGFPECLTMLCDADTCTDMDTGLIWQRDNAGSNYNRATAVSYCHNSLDIDGGGWRLPTIDELRTLVRGCSAIETGGACGVDDSCLTMSCTVEADCNPAECTDGGGPGGCYIDGSLNGSCREYWSSSLTENSSYGWALDFELGKVYHTATIGYHSTRCVKDPD